VPPEIIFALLSMCFLGTSDFLYKWGQKWDLRGGPFMLVQNFAYMPTAFLLAYFRSDLIWSLGLWFGLLNGVLAFTAFLFILLALRHGEAVSLIPIVRLSFAITALLTITLIGEEVNLIKGLALLLAGSAVLVGGGRIFSGQGQGQRRSLFLAVAAMFLFGFIGLFIKLGLGMGATPAAMTLAQSIGVFCMALPFSIYSGDSLPRRGGALWVPLICGVLTSSSYVSLSVGFTYGDAVVIAPIVQLSFVLTGALAIIFLGERLSVRKSLGVVCAVVSILIFATA
jgi:drug/metabolite transporter (DMT)-like permease